MGVGGGSGLVYSQKPRCWDDCSVLFSLGICSWASDTTAGATWETVLLPPTKETSARPEETRRRARSALTFRGQGVCGRLLEENCRVCFALRRRTPCALPVCAGRRRRSVQAAGLLRVDAGRWRPTRTPARALILVRCPGSRVASFESCSPTD